MPAGWSCNSSDRAKRSSRPFLRDCGTEKSTGCRGGMRLHASGRSRWRRWGIHLKTRPSCAGGRCARPAPGAAPGMCRSISARKKFFYTMPLNRATVVGCAISATRNYLKSHGPTKSNPLFGNNRAKSLLSCARIRGRHSSNFLSRAPPTNPYSTRCSAGALPPATSCLGAFRTPAVGAWG